MKKFVQNKLKDQKGMTLIELLAVIVIIAIIAAIAIPAIGNIIENSRFGAAKSDFTNAYSAATIYKADEGKFPTTLAELKPFLEDEGTLTAFTAVEAEGGNTIAGEFEIGGEPYTLTATAISEINDMSSAEFKTKVGAD